MRDFKKVKSVGTSSHPSADEVSVSVFYEDGTTDWILLPGRVCEQLEYSFRQARERYLPWIKENFDFVGGDATWKCRTCGKLIEGNAKEGGLVIQLEKHLAQSPKFHPYRTK